MMIFLFCAVHCIEAGALHFVANCLLERRLWDKSPVLSLAIAVGIKLCNYLFIAQAVYLIYLLVLLFDFLIVSILFRGTVLNKIFIVLLIYAAMFMADAIAFVMLVGYKQLPFQTLETSDVSILTPILSRIVFLLLVVAYWKLRDFLKQMITMPLLAIQPPLALCVVQFFASPIGKYYHQNPLAVYAIGSIALLLAAVFFYVILLYRTQKRVLELDLKNNKMLQQVQERHYRELYQKHQELASIRHDIAALLRHYDRIDEPDYIKKLERTLDDTLTLTGVQDLDVILLSLRDDVRSHGLDIHYEVKISSRLDWIKPIHFFIFMVNAVENALQAVLALPNSLQKAISIKLVGSNVRLSIRIQNKTAQVHKRAINRIIKRTTDKNGHGIGMKNMMTVLRHYDGYMEYETKGNDFILSVMLQNLAKDA